MIRLSEEAVDDVVELRQACVRKSRIEAARTLIATLERATARIANDPSSGLPAPRPYAELAAQGRLWTKVGNYWFAYFQDQHGPIIVGVYWAVADIPRRR